MHKIVIEAPENRSRAALIALSSRAGLLRLGRAVQAGEGVKRALRALAGLTKLKVKYDGFEVALDLTPGPGLADSGDLDLADLMVAVGGAARERETAVVLILDKLQYVAEEQLAALISALHRANQLRLPVTLVGAGLPQLLGRMGRAKSHAERSFEYDNRDYVN